MYTIVKRFIFCFLLLTINLKEFSSFTLVNAQNFKAPHVKWVKIFDKHGITLFKGDRPEYELPLLKGKGRLNINLYDLMAVAEDVKLQPHWVYRMTHAKIIDRPNPFNLKVYVQFDFPWPTSNRDNTLQINVKRIWKPNHEVWIYFKEINHAKYPPQNDCVRVARSRGYTRLRWISPTQTEITYMIDADPGGSLPKWLVRWLSQNLPFKMITSLKGRVKNMKGKYQDFVNRWDPRISPQKDAPLSFTLPGWTPN